MAVLETTIGCAYRNTCQLTTICFQKYYSGLRTYSFAFVNHIGNCGGLKGLPDKVVADLQELAAHTYIHTHKGMIFFIICTLYHGLTIRTYTVYTYIII